MCSEIALVFVHCGAHGGTGERLPSLLFAFLLYSTPYFFLLGMLISVAVQAHGGDKPEL